MATGFSLPPPPPLDIHDASVAEKWKRFKLAWDNYALATELNKKSEGVQVATFLTIIGEESWDVYSTFSWAEEGDAKKLKSVLDKFAEYCEPRKNIPFERYRFNQRVQEAGETYDQYRTALRKLAESCEFANITPDEILRDKLIFGIRDDKVRERLLRESQLTLQKADEICRAAESTAAQMKEVGDTVSAFTLHKNARRPRDTRLLRNKGCQRGETKSCGNCGRTHEAGKCMARGKTCNECGKANHFAVVCRSHAQPEKANRQTRVKAIDEADSDEDVEECYVIGDIAAVATTTLDYSQVITLKLESGNALRFQPDTGAQCNVIPLHLYKKASNDHELKQVKITSGAISAYGGSRLPVVGEVKLKVWRDTQHCWLNCKLIDSQDIRPILGRKACMGMKIIQYTDNDAMNKPDMGSARVYAVNDKSDALTKEALIKAFPEVFSESVGKLEGEYHIKLDKAACPTQHAPRRVPVTLREQLRSLTGWFNRISLPL
ncbi:uncharacterized protein LOC141882321 [Acropora palmata]|uniref:uncharacterized protein LOC141882321 n=1 Tax=Acropora palmata TaxID=6131 RepID=UPI003DA00E71